MDLTQVQGGQVKTLHLCAKCAAEKGVQTPAALADTTLGGLLAALGGELGAIPEPVDSGTACPACGATLQDFRETGRLGCAHCYETFAEPLAELLRRLHGSAHHTGKLYHPPGSPVPSRPQPTSESVAVLRDQLKRAIEAEQFERAAELRDRLRERE